ncbi:hypothetical protein CR513_03807, partial [Mucuna pruriens]
MPPSKSFLIVSSLGAILQSGSVLIDIPVIDETFYGNKIHEYEKELKTRVMFSYEEACEFIGRELMHEQHLSIQAGRQINLPYDKFVNSIRNGSWPKTSHGLRSPVGSVLYDLGWEVAPQISAIPFIDKLLGVIVGFSGNYKVVIHHFKPASNLANLTTEAALLIMECIKYSSGSSKLINSLKGNKLLEDKHGFQNTSGLPEIDNKFYREKIFTYKGELKQIGVVVDFEEAIKKFAHLFKQKASQTSFNQAC